MKDDFDQFVKGSLHNFQPPKEFIRKIRKRRSANLRIIFHLALFAIKHKEMRFSQLLRTLKLDNANYYMESADQLKSLKTTLKARYDSSQGRGEHE